ncbi:MAG: type I restriction endonuclease subunit R [Ottowia sp.]|nr:type I restriction endonuclease subunit R [Ottowia sp.]
MGKSRYSEEEAVQKPAGERLCSLDWELVYAWNEEVLGKDGTLGRASYREVVLRRYLVAALRELNGWMTPEECEAAVDRLCETLATDSPLQTNEKKYGMLRDGIPVERVREDGSSYTEKAQVFDFAQPQNNHFLAVEELWVHSPDGVYHRRPDLVGFVNGIPLLFVEFKRHDKDVRRAYEDNYTDYQDTIAQIFHFNAFVMLSNGLEAKVGTLGSTYEFFHEWKRLAEGEAGAVDLDTMLRGMCNQRTFMDLFENFILFDHSGSQSAKILARNHQYLGVNQAVEAYRKRELRAGKLGVFWHTQGSGKSYSMVFFAQKVRRAFAGSPTFVVVTDREELNRQIADTFAGCGLLGAADAAQYTATSGANLYERLAGNPSFVFTLIHKFNDECAAPVESDHDIIILSDEAHRTNNGALAANMVRMLPNASRLGFTGTPLFSYDNITERTFGGYVSVYDFATAVADGATVPLFYENRSDLLKIDNPEINDKLAEAVEAADVDENQRARLERDLKREYHVLTSEKRLDEIARDFVAHYSGIWECGKAMFISVDKVTAARMHALVQKYWTKEIAAQKAALKHDTQQEALARQRKIDWMRATEMCLVVSEEQNEIATFAKWGVDIAPHRKKMATRKLDKEFRDADNPFRIVFVCAMWLTGFDVKPLAVMYFDKPMKAHSLMQAIARANRVSEGKSNGLIVDYIGVVKALRRALADYTRDPGEGRGNEPMLDKGKLIARIGELLNSIEAFLSDCGFSLGALIAAANFDRLARVKDGADAVSVNDETRKRFGIMARELFKLFKFCERGDIDATAWARRDAIDAIYKLLTKRRDTADTSDIMVQLQQIIDEHIDVCASDDKSGRRFDISRINFDLLRREFEQVRQKNLLVGDLRKAIEKRLEKALRDNPARADFYKRYQQIIDEYNKEQDRASIEATFEKLMKFSEDLDDEQKRYVREGFTNERQLAVFDMLNKDSLTKDEIAQVKKLARELVDKIQERLAQMTKWREKPETRAEVVTLIRDELYRLPPANYPDEAIAGYRAEIYEYFYARAA